MKLRSPWLLRLAGVLAAALLRVWLRTLRIRGASLDVQPHPADPEQARFIYAFWHESLIPFASVKTRVHVLISRHADGEVIAQACQSLGVGVVRGSTSRGGTEALLQLLRHSAATHVAITPDGPRGPRRHVQLGTIFLASCSGLPIVPVGVGYARAWRVGSWDRMALPCPGSVVTGVILPPIVVPPQLDRAGLERFRGLVEEQLLAATGLAEAWAAGGTPPTAAPRLPVAA